MEKGETPRRWPPASSRPPAEPAGTAPSAASSRPPAEPAGTAPSASSSRPPAEPAGTAPSASSSSPLPSQPVISPEPVNSPSPPPPEPVVPAPPPRKSVLPLPPTTAKSTLFLDLDLTLILSTRERPCHKHYFTNGQQYVIKRPGFEKFLTAARNASFEVAIFTARTPEYASPIIDELDPTGELIAHRLYRDSCTEANGGVFLKNLAATGRSLLRPVIMDDCPDWVRPRENAVAVKPFNGKLTDTELLRLVSFFTTASGFIELQVAAKNANSQFVTLDFRRREEGLGGDLRVSEMWRNRRVLPMRLPLSSPLRIRPSSKAGLEEPGNAVMAFSS